MCRNVAILRENFKKNFYIWQVLLNNLQLFSPNFSYNEKVCTQKKKSPYPTNSASRNISPGLNQQVRAYWSPTLGRPDQAGVNWCQAEGLVCHWAYCWKHSLRYIYEQKKYWNYNTISFTKPYFNTIPDHKKGCKISLWD